MLEFDTNSSVAWDDLSYVSGAAGDSTPFTSNKHLSQTDLLSLDGSTDFSNYWPALDQSFTAHLQRTDSSLTDDIQSYDESYVGGFDGQGNIAMSIEPNYGGIASFSSHFRSVSSVAETHDHTNLRGASCTDLASSTLHSLHLPNNFCVSFQAACNPGTLRDPSAPSTIDQILTTNRQAIANFHTLLQCPCSANSSLTLALALIISKVMSCYTAIGRCSITQQGQHRTASISSSSRSAFSGCYSGTTTPALMEDMMVDVPMNLGAFQLDAEDEQHLKLQLVLSELRKCSRLINNFAHRYCDSDQGDDVYGALEKFLWAEMRTAVKEVTAVLKMHDGGL